MRFEMGHIDFVSKEQFVQLTKDLIAERERARREGKPWIKPVIDVDVLRGGLASLIDHTLLKPEATPEQIRKLCEEARQYKFASVCVNSRYVSLCAKELEGSQIPITAVVGFPLGASSTVAKLCEAEDVIQNGAKELDMVLPIGYLKAGDYDEVMYDIAAVVELAHRESVLVKVIIEACLLADEEKVAASLLAVHAGADFVKTSTGFSTGGAKADDVALIRRVVGPSVGVKAAGGIRTREDALTMIAHGANRIGASASVQIVST